LLELAFEVHDRVLSDASGLAKADMCGDSDAVISASMASSPMVCSVMTSVSFVRGPAQRHTVCTTLESL
jgi:hypothetical protein